MLTIRDAQMRFVAQKRQGLFEEQTLHHLEAEYPEHFTDLGPDGVRALIERAKSAAAMHRIDSPDALAMLIELMLEFGESFERTPERARLRKLLEHPTLPGDVKVYAIRDRIEQHTGGRRLMIFRPDPNQ
ncbi:MAG TPA: hypothetical protein VFA65_00200 [Bryobacteraceae bacterium]|nr:hypothetical protein [Bryobacteraceae bacterium]